MLDTSIGHADRQMLLHMGTYIYIYAPYMLAFTVNIVAGPQSSTHAMCACSGQGWAVEVVHICTNMIVFSTHICAGIYGHIYAAIMGAHILTHICGYND